MSLEKNVEGSRNSGFVGETEANVLATVANAGNAAAHRGWSPDETEFRKLLEALEQFIKRTVISGKSVLEIAARIPARHPRPGKALRIGAVDDGPIEGVAVGKADDE
ncbi:GMP synthase PP-ATPase subunit [Paraburkholderia sp. GAS334]